MTRPLYPFAADPGCHVILAANSPDACHDVLWCGAGTHEAVAAWSRGCRLYGSVWAEIWTPSGRQVATWSALWDHLHTTTTEAP